MVMESATVSRSSELEQLKTQAVGKDEEIGRLTAEAEGLRAEVEQLTADKQSLQARLGVTEGRSVDLSAQTNMDQVRLRIKPDTGSRRIRELKKGTAVHILEEVVNEKNESWAYVEVDNQAGYIMMQYLELDEGQE